MVWRTAVMWLMAVAMSGCGTKSRHAAISDKPDISPQQACRFEAKTRGKAKLNYLLFLPAGYAQSDQRWPLILFLHGLNEAGSNLEKVKLHGPPKVVETQPDFPFIVVSPQTSIFGWNTEALNALLDHLMETLRVDPDRVYLTGLSMGGYGCWELAAAHPEKFAAIVPICGGGNPKEAARLARLPIWVFHGEHDNLVPLHKSEEMVAAVRAAGGDVKFTVVPNAGHICWTHVYNDPEFYRWLLSHKRDRPTS